MEDRHPFAPTDWSTPAGVAETHVSVVTFLGDRAYKLLKPVDMGFLDHSTRQARRAGCEREVALNRRLAPDVYLGVMDVRDADGAVLDHMVVMRRMPAERRLSALLDTGEADDAVRAVARQVAAFHATATRGPQIDAAGSPAALSALWEQSFTQMGPFVGTVLPSAEFDAVREGARAYLAGRGPLLRDRAETGLMRDGHGDLLCDDVFLLPDGPRILDCIAFADHMRWGDVLLDVAFLGMDLEARGHPALASRLLHWYREFADEHHPQSLWHHYVAYRAHVRSKIACLRHVQGDPSAAHEAARLHALAARHALRARVRIVLVGGTPGTGKSVVSAEMAETCGMVLLRSDELRKDMAGLSHTASASAPPGEGLYRPERVAEVYAELVRRAGRLAAMGESVVIDASWSGAGERERIRAEAARSGAAVVELRCDAPAAVAERRVTARQRRGDDASDAGLAVTRDMRARFAPWPEAVTVRTDGTVAEAVATALEALEGQAAVAI